MLTSSPKMPLLITPLRPKRAMAAVATANGGHTIGIRAIRWSTRLPRNLRRTWAKARTKPTAVPNRETMTPSCTVFQRMRRLTGSVTIPLTISQPSADRATVKMRNRGSPTITNRAMAVTVTSAMSVRSRVRRIDGRAGRGGRGPVAAGSACSARTVTDMGVASCQPTVIPWAAGRPWRRTAP